MSGKDGARVLTRVCNSGSLHRMGWEVQVLDGTKGDVLGSLVWCRWCDETPEESGLIASCVLVGRLPLAPGDSAGRRALHHLICHCHPQV